MSTERRTGEDRSRVLGLDNGTEALRESAEFRGPIEPLDGHEHANDHFALVYEGRDEQFAAAVPFLRQGLERGEKCMYVGDEASLSTVADLLRERGIDVDGAVESGALVFESVGNTYLRDGSFDPESMMEIYGAEIEAATAEFEALRVVAETDWLVEESVPIEAFMEYESRINDLFDDADAIALCQYDRERFPAEELIEIVRAHPHLISDTTVCHNVYYTPPEEFCGPERPENELDRMLGTLRERARAKASLRDQTAVMREQHEIISRSDQSFERKLRRLFDLGCERFGLDFGAMARIDAETDTLEIEHVSGDHDRFRPGLELPLSETYCAATADERGVVGIDDPETVGFGDSVARRELGVEAYLGTHVAVDGGDDRTFFFLSEAPRDRPFSDEELTFQRLMGQWIEYELGRRQREAFQRELYEVTADSDVPFEGKLRRLLELGRARFDLDIGFLSRVTGDRFELVDAVGSHELIQPEVTADLPETYCRHVVEDDGLVAVADAPAAGWEGKPAYETYGLDSYIGTTVTVGGDRYGTLCFAAREARDRPFSGAERTFLELTAQWVSYELEREQRQAQLAALNEMSRDLMDAETEAAIAGTTAEHAAETLELPLTAVVRYDRDEGRLEPAARTERAVDELPTAALSETPSGPLWEAFTTGETRLVEDVDVSGAGDAVTEIAAVPLGSHGVFVTATEAPGGFSETELEFVETTAATVETACGRADRERLLAERERALEEQNDSLERLNRINDTIRSIGQSLVGASTRGEIETVVCEQLADVGPYELAWVGDHDSVTDEVTPREWAGAEKGYLDATTVTADERTTGRGPAGRAVRTREPQVVDNIVEDPDFEPWRQAALTRGYHASIALPLVYEDALYGVLNVYANQPGVFDDLERSVLAELADTIAYAINATESKRSLVSDEVTELEFAVGDDDLGVVEIASETGCDLTLEGIVPTPEGRPRVYASTRGVPAEELRATAVDLETSEPTLVSEYEDGDEPVCLFEATLGERSLCETVRRHGGRPRALTVSGGVATLVVELGADADVREFVEAFGDAYADTELVAQRSRERPRQSPTELRATLTEELTDRQLEVLQTAYFGGYFDTPRDRTGSEVAESLGISQPTFNTHVRAAHRKLCRQLFESGAPEN
ncbi:MEDS domain-containing protein [Halosimplex pelagicum]|uniref:MEDS domain-containing protein n=1 Tax=Halosimplex pelagicum TaxID=869886 RepID=A0A7D5PG44_9EURY|nr:MEDS domain-containing protein [Halosimplex pelagicum]QLH83439.1 MEDS domain-containing protein [Halosimplex pelagicum]